MPPGRCPTPSPPANIRGSTKYRSASVNSNSSFDSYFSGFGNHFETEQELSSFDSPSFVGSAVPSQHPGNQITPPIKRDQPSPFQPIYAGFQSHFGAFEGVDSSKMPFFGDVAEDLENKFDQRARPSPFESALSFGSDFFPQPSRSREEAASAPPLDRITPLPNSASPPPAATPASAATEGDDKDKKKKRKKKKKKKNKTADGDDLENPSAENQEAMRCFNCDQMGHLSRDCTQPRACFLCGETTHVAKQCKYSALAKGAAEPGTEQPTIGNIEADAHTADSASLRGSPPPVPGFTPPPTSNGALPEAAAAAAANAVATTLPREGRESRADSSGDKKKNICLNCSEPGHRLKNCPYGRKCFQCGKVGHVARECPSISEAKKLMQKRRAEESPSPDSMLFHSNLGSRLGTSGAASVPPITYSSVTSNNFFPSPVNGGRADGGSGLVPADGAAEALPMSAYSRNSNNNGSDSELDKLAAAGGDGSGKAALGGTPINPAHASNNGSGAGSVDGRSTVGFGGTVSPFAMGSGAHSERPSSCSPALMFGNGAFSSFASVGLSGGAARSMSQPQPHPEDDLDPSEEMDDPHLQDFVSHLLTDLDINDKA